MIIQLSFYIRQNLEQIMDRKTASFFAPVARNIKRADNFEIVDFKGRQAARMSISMRDRGHPDDWGRFGKLGEAQRVQIQEKEIEEISSNLNLRLFIQAEPQWW